MQSVSSGYEQNYKRKALQFASLTSLHSLQLLAARKVVFEFATLYRQMLTASTHKNSLVLFTSCGSELNH